MVPPLDYRRALQRRKGGVLQRGGEPLHDALSACDIAEYSGGCPPALKRIRHSGDDHCKPLSAERWYRWPTPEGARLQRYNPSSKCRLLFVGHQPRGRVCSISYDIMTLTCLEGHCHPRLPTYAQ
ncbi:hypothetical protein LIA77_08021 [Sarocladium implicatum]|nr:hypothetical protein LIA77_08021 [Sarocladium implicatum]